MKKVLLLTFFILNGLVFSASFDEEDKVILKQEQRLEQERTQKELEQREKTFEKLNLEKIEDIKSKDEIEFYISKIKA